MSGSFSSFSRGMASILHQHVNYLFGLCHNVIKNYDPRKVYTYNYWIYVFSGFWQYESPKQWKRNLYRLYQHFIRVVYVVAITFFVIDAVMVRHDFDKLSFNMSSTVLLVSKMLQLIMLSSSRSEVEGVFQKLENHLHVDTVGKSEEDKRIMKQHAEIILKITIMFYSVLVTLLPIRVIADTAMDSKAYLLPVPFKEFLNAYYDFVYAHQVLLSFHFMMTNLAYDLFGFSFIVRFISHYEILEKNFLKIKTLYPRRNFEKYVRGYVEGRESNVTPKDVLIRKANYLDKMQKFLYNYKLDRYNVLMWRESERCREEKTFQLLKEGIKHHQKLIAEVKLFCNVYSRPMLIQVFGIVLLVGIGGLQIIFYAKKLNLHLMQILLYVVTTLFNLLCLCSFCSELTSKSLSATNALYDTPWYDMSISNRNVVNLILEKLMQAPVLKGGGMVVINRVTYVKFIQSSYNLVALFKNKIVVT